DGLVGRRLEQVTARVANAWAAGLLVRSGLDQPVAVAIGASLIVLLAVWVWRTRPSAGTTSGVAMAVLLLGSPLAWVGYSLFLLPLVARMRTGLALILAAALLCIPRLVLQDESDASPLIRYTLGAAYTIAWLILLGSSVTSARRQRGAWSVDVLDGGA